MKILLTGGGTAGHVTPNLALLPFLRKQFDEIIYVGSKNGQERELLSPHTDIKFYTTSTAKLIRKNILKNLAIPFLLARGIRQAKKILIEESPDIIFSKGGYVSIPTAIAASKLKIPLICHESDFSLGLANRFIAKRAKYVCTTFSETAKTQKNGIWTGSPIRSELLLARREDSMKKLGLNQTKPVLLITGGSLGARVLNESVETILPKLVQQFQILHITGKGKSTNFNHRDYHQTEFAKNMEDFIASADIVVSRAGSNTIFELATLKKPMLLIPLPRGNSRGDQVENAMNYEKKGFARLLFEENLNPKNLERAIQSTKNDSEILRKTLEMAKLPNGVQKILSVIKQTINEDILSKRENQKSLKSRIKTN